MISAFLIASIILAITPGPAVIYVLTRTIAHGRAAGFASIAGVALGNFGNALGASLGLAALFAVSSVAFTVVKFAGALYLIFLGVRALSSRPGAAVAAQPQSQSQSPLQSQTQSPPLSPQSASVWPNLRDGFVVALFNPKTALFFAAFLPQFMDSSGSAMMQSVMLGALFVAVAASTDAVYVMVATAAQARLGRIVSSGRIGRYLTASTFIGLGIYTAFASPRAAK